MTQVLAYIGLGSNLEQPVDQLQRALPELNQIPGSSLQASSSLYLSSPMGSTDQPDYVNSVAILHTELPPMGLLDELQRIEQAHGRIRTQHWGPRTLDLDLLLYGDKILQNDRLRVPHPGIGERSFVLLPLAELAPDLQIPGLGAVSEVLLTSNTKNVEKLML